MNVRLNKARKNGATPGVDDNVSRLTCFADACNEAVADQEVPLQDGILFVHRQERSAFDENRFLHWVSGDGCRVPHTEEPGSSTSDSGHLIPDTCYQAATAADYRFRQSACKAVNPKQQIAPTAGWSDPAAERRL